MKGGRSIGRSPAVSAAALALLFLFSCSAKPVTVKIEGPAAAAGPTGPQLSFCVTKGTLGNTFRHRSASLKTDDYYHAHLADFFKMNAPYESIQAVVDDPVRYACDVLIVPYTMIYVTPLGRVDASVSVTVLRAGASSEKLMEASARGESSVEAAAARVGRAVFEALAPGTGLYGKVASQKTAAMQAFEEVAAQYRVTLVKPVLPEEARKFKVQAEAAFGRKDFDEAAARYLDALKIAPWWPEGHFNRALILGETGQFRTAIGEMRKYLMLVPDAPDARAAQDKIYEWEGLAGRRGGTGRN